MVGGSARWHARAGALAVVALAGLLLAGSVGAAAPMAPSVRVAPLGAVPAAGTVKVLHQNFPGTYFVNTLGSYGTQVLSDEQLSNFSYQLVLSNLTPNTTKSLGVMPGGYGIVPGPIVGAGTRFFVSVLNTTNDQEFYYAVTKTGTVVPIWTPMGHNPAWQLVYGNATALIVAETGQLWVLDPMTRAIVANYATVIPSGLLVYAVVPEGPLLYLAGSLAKGNATSADLGVVNQSSGQYSPISPLKYYAPPLSAAFFGAAAASTGAVYVGGGELYSNTTASGSFTTYTVRPFFDRYTPSTAKFTNLAALLPVGNETIFGLTPWLTSVALCDQTYDYSLTSWTLTSQLWALGTSGGKLVNKTGLLPHGFVIEPLDTMGFGGGYISVGGTTAVGSGELVAIKP